MCTRRSGRSWRRVSAGGCAAARSQSTSARTPCNPGSPLAAAVAAPSRWKSGSVPRARRRPKQPQSAGTLGRGKPSPLLKKVAAINIRLCDSQNTIHNLKKVHWDTERVVLKCVWVNCQNALQSLAQDKGGAVNQACSLLALPELWLTWCSPVLQMSTLQNCIESLYMLRNETQKAAVYSDFIKCIKSVVNAQDSLSSFQSH